MRTRRLLLILRAPARPQPRYAGTPSWRWISCWTSRRSCPTNCPRGWAPRPLRPRLETVGRLRPV